MDKKELIYLLSKIKKGETDIDKAADVLSALLTEEQPREDRVEIANLDQEREQRTGYPEVIFCEGKSKDQIQLILHRMLEHQDNALGTRLSEEKYESLREVFPELRYHRESKIMKIERKKRGNRGKGKILLITGGTSDIPIAEEAGITAEFFGNEVERMYDVGVAGLHRLMNQMEVLQQARVIIAVAGMEGALPSVVSGLVRCPVIGLPTSVGYGANFAGVSALLSMLNSCAPGLSVVNIDNGFGAGYLAGVINQL